MSGHPSLLILKLQERSPRQRLHHGKGERIAQAKRMYEKQKKQLRRHKPRLIGRPENKPFKSSKLRRQRENGLSKPNFFSLSRGTCLIDIYRAEGKRQAKEAQAQADREAKERVFQEQQAQEAERRQLE